MEAVEKSAELDRDHEFYLVVRDFSARHCHFLFGRLVEFVCDFGVRILYCSVLVYFIYHYRIFCADVQKTVKGGG